MSMHLLQVRHLSLKYNSTLLTQPFDLDLYPTEILGVIGANGSGKTTLFKTLLRENTHFTGDITCDLDPFYVPQNAIAEGCISLKSYLFSFLPHLSALAKTIFDAEETGIQDPLGYADAISEFSDRGGYSQVALMLQSIERLGFHEDDLKRPLHSFSGGERRQLALSSAFLNWPLVFLDEPTNHLDIDAIERLIDSIHHSDSTFVVVSHDRNFLDQICSRILEIEHQKVSQFMGNFSDYQEEKSRLFLEKQRLSARLNKEIKHLKGVERDYKDWGASREKFKKSAGDSGFEGARAARLQKRAIQAQTRVKVKIEKLEEAKPWLEKSYRFSIDSGAIPKGACVSLYAFTCDLSEVELFEPLSMQFGWGEKWAVLGANGIGKSTLMKTLRKGFDESHPHLFWSKSVRLGYLPQDIIAPEKWVRELFSPLQYKSARHLMGCFKLFSELFDRPCSQLSEGELRKVFWIKLLLESPNVLLLDEPTSHLDLPTVLFLEKILAQFQGTLILASHDQAFLDRLCDNQITLKSKV